MILECFGPANVPKSMQKYANQALVACATQRFFYLSLGSSLCQVQLRTKTLRVQAVFFCRFFSTLLPQWVAVLGLRVQREQIHVRKWRPRVGDREPKGAKRVPIGLKKEPKESQKGTQRIQKGGDRS